MVWPQEFADFKKSLHAHLWLDVIVLEQYNKFTYKLANCILLYTVAKVLTLSKKTYIYCDWCEKNLAGLENIFYSIEED